jgi:hypothetical protein
MLALAPALCQPFSQAGHDRLTKMGGPSAPDDLHQGCVTQAWLATSEDELARSTGGYFYHQRPRAPNPIAADPTTQEDLLAECTRISGQIRDRFHVERPMFVVDRAIIEARLLDDPGNAA